MAVQQRIPKFQELLGMSREEQRTWMEDLSRQFTDKELAQRFGTSLNRVRFLRKELGIRKGARGQMLSAPGEGGNGTPASTMRDGAVLASSSAEGMGELLAYRAEGRGDVEEFAGKMKEIQTVLQVLGDRNVRYVIEIQA